MTVPPLVGCAIVASASAVFCFDVRGVLTRYAMWRFHRLRRVGLKPVPDNETAYVRLTRRYMRWVGFVFVPIGVLGVIAALLAQ
jgi:hypothetical protein